jgi:hypothetical protein
LTVAPRAATGVGPYDQWRAEFDQDRGILNDKLAILRTLMNGR